MGLCAALRLQERPPTNDSESGGGGEGVPKRRTKRTKAGEITQSDTTAWGLDFKSRYTLAAFLAESKDAGESDSAEEHDPGDSANEEAHDAEVDD